MNFGYWPAGTDIVLLTTLAATAGSGGVGNLVISNWVRDKGFGMGATVGAIPSALGGRNIHLSHVGNVFDMNPESLRPLARVETVCHAGPGSSLGRRMLLGYVPEREPRNRDCSARRGSREMGAGAFQAKYMAERLWSGFWVSLF